MFSCNFIVWPPNSLLKKVFMTNLAIKQHTVAFDTRTAIFVGVPYVLINYKWTISVYRCKCVSG